MKLQIICRFIVRLVFISLLLPNAVGSSSKILMGQAAPKPQEPGELSPVAEYAASGGMGVEPFVQPATQLARQDYQNVYNEAMRLLTVATRFRTQELQLGTTVGCRGLKDDALAECLKKNYKNFNEGRLFYRFCASFEPQAVNDPGIQLNLSDACENWNDLKTEEQRARVLDIATKPLVDRPAQQPIDVRNMLLLARDYFGFLALGPAEQQIDQGDVRTLGKGGVISATSEIANVHLIFGSEYMVDALDYRFGGSNDPRAEAILQEEIKQLKFAVQQFQLGIDVLAYAFNADFGGPGGKRIGDFFGVNEYDLFNTISERMIDSLSELALRYRQLGQNQTALNLYAQAFRDQYVQSLSIADSARKNGPSFLLNGGWRLMNNLEHLRARAQAIRDGVNPFGYRPEFVPIQPYEELRKKISSDDTLSLYSLAVKDEEKASVAQREFDQNGTLVNNELLQLRIQYEAKLLEICGQQIDYAATCESGLMKRNYLDMVAAFDEINLAYDGMRQIPARIELEQQRAGRVISLIMQGGRKMAAIEYSRALVNLETNTDVVIDSNSFDLYAGAEVRAEISYGIQFPPFQAKVSLSTFAGTRWSKTHTSSTQKTINYDAIQLGELNSLQAVEQATTQASIEGANSEAVIKGFLLDQVSKLIQYDLAVNHYNQVAAEHNSLVEQYHMWLNLWNLAQDNLANSYLNNPAYRILRDQWTVAAARSFNLAAQYAYLTAKAAEYNKLEPYPALNDIFKARTTRDLALFLIELDAWHSPPPGELNRFPYVMSMTCDILHLYDQTLSGDPKRCKEQPPDVRYAEFQKFLQQHLVKDQSGNVTSVQFSFSTSLVDSNLFSQAIWNNRIAAVHSPLADSDGMVLNLWTRQLGNIGQPWITLVHDGHTTYRTQHGDIVYYTPYLAQPLSPTQAQKATTGTVVARINGDPQTGVATNAFFNLSVAASNWTLRIDLTDQRNANLDLNQLEDIEIIMDTTGIARPGLEQQAQVDSAQLQTEYNLLIAR